MFSKKNIKEMLAPIISNTPQRTSSFHETTGSLSVLS
jgi:hypothetical protein